MAKRKTNTQFVESIMEYSDFGAMAQLFIMDAIKKVSNHVANMPLAELQKQFGENAMISPEAWHGVAKEIAQKFEEHYKN
jgi:hypothetical protein